MTKKPVEDDSMDWLEMATGGKTPDKTSDKTPAKQVEPPVQKKAEAKPVTPPSKSTKAADWLGLKSDDEEEEYDFLKASSFSAPARQGQPLVNILIMIIYALNKIFNDYFLCKCILYGWCNCLLWDQYNCLVELIKLLYSKDFL
jgi:hypothetical protein